MIVCSCVRLSAKQNYSEEEKIILTLKKFYTEYITSWSMPSRESIEEGERILQKYVTQNLLDYLDSLTAHGYLSSCPFIQAQDYDLSWIETMIIKKEPSGENIYSFSRWSGYYKRYITIKMTVVQENDSYKIDSLIDIYRVHFTAELEIQDLMRQTLNWANSKDVIRILPILTDSRDSIYIGFDLNKHESNLNILRATGFFANEFIENYNQIILTLDKKLRNHEYVEWLVGDLPTFRFANGINVWCNCQDVPYDEPNPWDNIEVTIINLNNDNAEAIWKYGGIYSDIKYNFRVVKENGKWKIAYLEEFDFEESTR